MNKKVLRGLGLYAYDIWQTKGSGGMLPRKGLKKGMLRDQFWCIFGLALHV